MTSPSLAGIRVLEVGNYMAGPFCALQLGDLGADIVKIENPRGGDLTRTMEPLIAGESGNFVRLNRNKRSLALDLKDERGKAVFRSLATQADVVVENLRPGTMADLELAPASLLAANSELVYVAITGWGSDGPYSQWPALDIIVQGMSGLMSVTGPEGGAPVKVGVAICDLVAGLYATIATLGALAARARDGRGQFIDVSMLEASVSLALWEAGQFFTTGEVARAAGSAHKVLAPYQAVRASDSYFNIGATTPPTWKAFCHVLEIQHLELEARFANANVRRRNLAELIQLIEAVTITRPASHWLSLLREAGVPCGEILDYGQVLTNKHLEARRFFVDLPHPRLGTIRTLATPLHLRGSKVRLERAGPLLGEHSFEILAEIGYADEEVRRLVSDAVVVTS